MPGATPRRTARSAPGPAAGSSSLLRGEVAAIEAKGTAVVVLEPTAADAALMYGPGDDHDLGPRVTDAAYRSVARPTGGAGSAPGPPGAGLARLTG